MQRIEEIASRNNTINAPAINTSILRGKENHLVNNCTIRDLCVGLDFELLTLMLNKVQNEASRRKGKQAIVSEDLPTTVRTVAR